MSNREQCVKWGVEAALEFLEKKQEKEKKSRSDRRLRNTKLLLKNYDLLKAHCQSSIYTVQQAGLTERPIDILDDIDRLDKEMYIESIKRSATRTYIIITHIDEMVRIYQAYCETSPRDEDRRRFRVMRAAYFDHVRMDIICEQEHIERSTYFRDTNEILEKLSALIFGIDGLSDVRQRCD